VTIESVAMRLPKISTFTEDELESLETESSNNIELKEFIPLSKIDPVYFEDSYCVFRSIRPAIPVETGRLFRSKAAGGSRSEATLEFFLIA
jgi:hypothetical protein